MWRTEKSPSKNAGGNGPPHARARTHFRRLLLPHVTAVPGSQALLPLCGRPVAPTPTPQLVIEEVSMLDGVLLDKLDAIARRLRIREANTPMGQGYGMAAIFATLHRTPRTFISAPRTPAL